VQDSEPSLEYLLGCSKISLESFGLSRLNRASNLRKELSQVAEEWVAAEVSFRLARLIVDRRDAGQADASLWPTQRAILSSGNQLTLLLLPGIAGDLTDVKAENKTVLAPKNIGGRKSGTVPASNAKEVAGKRSTIAKRKIPNVKMQTRAGTTPCAPQPDHACGPTSFAERVHPRCASTSLRAVTELRALDKVASGSPEMHAGSLRTSAGASLFVRESAFAPVVAIPRARMKTNRPDRPFRKYRQPSRPMPARKLLPEIVVHRLRAVSA
jgi:hypothetical protein